MTFVYSAQQVADGGYIATGSEPDPASGAGRLFLLKLTSDAKR
jgi:hypothetical protein